MFRSRLTTLVTIGAVAMILGGCEKKEPPAPQPSPAAERSATQMAPPVAPPPPPPAPAAADTAKDDPAAPSWLPHPNEIGGWVRTSNTQVLTVDAWAAPGSDHLRACAEGYLLESVVVCEYTSVLPKPGGTVAVVTLIEAHGTDDAFGLFTCVVPTGPRQDFVGSLSCLEQSGQTDVVHGWEGKYYINVSRAPQTAPPPQVSVEKLAAGLLRPVPSEQPPALLAYFPTAGRIAGQVWVTRKHLDILPQEVRREVLRGSTLETTTALGLSLETLVAVVAYDPGEGERPNYVWLVRYPGTRQVTEAIGRYKNVLRSIKPAPLVMMEVSRDADGRPNSPYLCGTWTADQESIMHVLSRVAANLPPQQ